MYPYKPLEPGDQIRVVAPSYSQHRRLHAQLAARAQKRLASLGYCVTFGQHVSSIGHLGTAPVAQRLADFHEAFADPEVAAILAFTGGWSCNELLPHIDWRLVGSHPKPLIGFSDITILVNALYAMTGHIGYLGPNFVTLGALTGWEYTLDAWQAALRGQSVTLQAGMMYSNLPKDPKQHRTSGWRTVQSGQAEGILLGGNFGSFYFLQGTPYQPQLTEPFILLAEDDDSSGAFVVREFCSQLESVLQLPGARQWLRGLLIGRFQDGVQAKKHDIDTIIKSKNLGHIPVIADIDFGHTVPLLTLPIGGRARIVAHGAQTSITLL